MLSILISFILIFIVSLKIFVSFKIYGSSG